MPTYVALHLRRAGCPHPADGEPPLAGGACSHNGRHARIPPRAFRIADLTRNVRILRDTAGFNGLCVELCMEIFYNRP